jgi:hypothetical protein
MFSTRLAEAQVSFSSSFSWAQQQNLFQFQQLVPKFLQKFGFSTISSFPSEKVAFVLFARHDGRPPPQTRTAQAEQQIIQGRQTCFQRRNKAKGERLVGIFCCMKITSDLLSI